MSRLEEIHEKGTSIRFNRFLINSNLCAQIKKLNLINIDLYDEDPMYCFQNVPALECFKFSVLAYRLSVQAIEALHQNVPSIQQFNIGKVDLGPFGRFLIDPIPNATIRSINLDLSCTIAVQDLSDIYVECLQYVEKKYLNLQHLTINCLEIHRLSNDDIRHIYDEGWLPILQSKGPQLQRIERLDVKPGVDIFQVLDNYDCKLNYLKVSRTGKKIDVNKLAKSNQRHYLHSLYVKNALNVHHVSLKDSTLRVLSLEYGYSNYDKVIVLHDLLKLLPDALRHLTLNNVAIIIGEKHEDAFKSSITSLAMSLSEKPFGKTGYDKYRIEKTVKATCPNIKMITLKLLSY